MCPSMAFVLVPMCLHGVSRGLVKVHREMQHIGFSFENGDSSWLDVQKDAKARCKNIGRVQ